MRLRLASRFLALLFGLALLTATAFAQQAPAPKANQRALWDKMVEQLREQVHGVDGAMGLALIDLTSGEQVLINSDELFATASSIKVALLAELYRQDQSGGPNHLMDRYTVRDTDFVPDSDIFDGLTPGVTVLTNRDLARMVVAVSDNAATNILIERVGMDNVNHMLDGLGLGKTRLRRKMMDSAAARAGRENISTPKEMATLLEAIFHGKFLDASHRQDLLDLLSTPKHSYFPVLLPEDVRVANKPGWLEGVRNDVGVIYAPNRPFVLAVMGSYLKDERAGEMDIARIAQIAFSFMDRIGRATPYGRLMAPETKP